ncbi:alcohol dehydrogenase [compost metagenome]
MNQTMKAAVVHALGEPLRIEEVKLPLPGPGQILVKIEASGVCHTDLHAAEGDWPAKPSLPFIPGYKGVGGLGHVAVQYARAMGLHVAAIDVDDAEMIQRDIGGARADLQEALDFAEEGLVKATIHRDKLDNINGIFDQMRAGKIEGRIVVEI